MSHSCEHKIRQRSSRACDQCRRLRTRCNRVAGSERCLNCQKRNLDCTAEGIDHKRGPPRGYLHALEDRLQDAEAIIGVFLALPDPSTRHLLAVLRQDAHAREILSRVEHSAFGPQGRKLRSWLIEAVNNSDSPAEFKRHTRLGLANDTANPLSTIKTNEWQDTLIRLLSQRHSSPSSPNAPMESPLSPALANGACWSAYPQSGYAASASAVDVQVASEYYSGSDDYLYQAYTPKSY